MNENKEKLSLRIKRYLKNLVMPVMSLMGTSLQT